VRDYEVVYVFAPTIGEDAIREKLDRYHRRLTEAGGEITAVDFWGARPLAYPIRKKETGIYVVVHFRADPTALPEYERLLKLDEDLLRYLIVLNEGYLTTSPFAQAPLEAAAPVAAAAEDEAEADEDEEEA